MNCKDSPYCFEFNEQGYCVTCGQKQQTSLDKLGEWPRDTWFQNRLAEVRYNELRKVRS